jgi:hypothetical protein
MRVIREGSIQPGDQIIKTQTGPEALTVAEADALLHPPGRDMAKVRRATQIPALSPGWQQSFKDILHYGTAPATSGTRTDPGWTRFRALKVNKVILENAIVS